MEKLLCQTHNDDQWEAPQTDILSETFFLPYGFNLINHF